ncbi:hypothetical protein H7K49_00385 [Paenibacillus typhae]|nr:hypothetical protein [Paenibacillus typhae]
MKPVHYLTKACADESFILYSAMGCSCYNTFLAEISRRLHELDENLTYEIGTVNADGQREFIISADGIADSFETVEMLCGKAPVYSNWIIIPFRPRMNSDRIQIDMGDVSLVSMMR